MKVVVNKCYGGFSLSPAGVAALAKRKGRKCYFFTGGLSQPYVRVTQTDAAESFMFTAFDVPVAPDTNNNEAWEKHYLTCCPEDRTDPDLVAVVEKMGRKANGSCAELRVVEIPDGVDWELDEYDGIETIHEKHRSW